MRLFTRHLLIELLKVFLAVLAGMTIPLMLILITQEALSQGLGLAQIIPLVPYILPMAMRFALPGTVLFAACSVYGRMSAWNEVVALKSLGISPTVILWPAYGLAVALSLLAVWVNDLAVSWGRIGAERVVIESFEEIAYGMLRKNGAYSTKKLKIVVKRVEGRRLIQPILSFETDNDGAPITFIAREAELRADPGQGMLTIVLEDTTIEWGDKGNGYWPGVWTYSVPLSEGARKAEASTSPSNLALTQIPSELRLQQEQIDRFEQEMASRAAFQLLTGEFQALAGPGWQKDQQVMDGMRYRWHRLRTEPHRRWANGFSCLCFVMVGAPTAIWLRRADLLGTFFVCFGPILLVYYPLLMYGVDQAKGGDLPPYAVWLGNLILAVGGLWITRRVQRY